MGQKPDLTSALTHAELHEYLADAGRTNAATDTRTETGQCRLTIDSPGSPVRFKLPLMLVLFELLFFNRGRDPESTNRLSVQLDPRIF